MHRGRNGYPADDPFRLTLHPDRLDAPLKWKKPCYITVNTASDLFHDDVPDKFICDVFATMRFSLKHIFEISTKRPRRMLEFFKKYHRSWPLPNVRLGISEDQKTFEERTIYLIQVPAATRFILFEPLLSSVNMGNLFNIDSRLYSCTKCYDLRSITRYQYENAECRRCGHELDWDNPILPGQLIHHVIVGGESGPRARPMHPDLVRRIRNQCLNTGVPFTFKSWGAWVPDDPNCNEGNAYYRTTEKTVGRVKMVKVGKKNSGRLLDGRTWDGDTPGAVSKNIG